MFLFGCAQNTRKQWHHSYYRPLSLSQCIYINKYMGPHGRSPLSASMQIANSKFSFTRHSAGHAVTQLTQMFGLCSNSASIAHTQKPCNMQLRCSHAKTTKKPAANARASNTGISISIHIPYVALHVGLGRPSNLIGQYLCCFFSRCFFLLLFKICWN